MFAVIWVKNTWHTKQPVGKRKIRPEPVVCRGTFRPMAICLWSPTIRPPEPVVPHLAVGFRERSDGQWPPSSSSKQRKIPTRKSQTNKTPSKKRPKSSDLFKKSPLNHYQKKGLNFFSRGSKGVAFWRFLFLKQPTTRHRDPLFRTPGKRSGAGSTV